MKSVEMTSMAEPCRLDKYLAAQDLGLSRARLQGLIREGWVTLNGGPAKASAMVKAGDRVEVRIPPPQPLDLAPENIPLDIVYEDAHLAVVDKPAGLTVHPAPGHPSGTLVNALLARYPNLPGIGGWRRPGIVHRLDKDTSGLMVVAKTESAHHSLSEQIQERRIRKGYTALINGIVANDEGVIDAPIGRDPRHRKRMAVVEGGTTFADELYRHAENWQGYAGRSVSDNGSHPSDTGTLRFPGTPLGGGRLVRGKKRPPSTPIPPRAAPWLPTPPNGRIHGVQLATSVGASTNPRNL